ncbi:hypothetical protein Patl1_00946 [Pistacia atlantica]|uniref:Uncharacterized protein n=1 Tax=Pistacia atlantica TaxID=434234 RepID=A0ACC1C6R7_9ROSI|nr:hypothetical protein Patl1_00946 [Pistacia atlantica]
MNLETKRPIFNSLPPILPNTPPTQSQNQKPTFLPIKRLTPNEIQYRRCHNLCYNCEETYTPGHHCKRLFLIDCAHDDVAEEMEEIEEDHEVAEISLNAITGTTTPQTMRVSGKIYGHPLMVLLDTGSTHNFLNHAWASRFGLKTKEGEKMNVMVANGEKLQCMGRLPETTTTIQGSLFAGGFFCH